ILGVEVARRTLHAVVGARLAQQRAAQRRESAGRAVDVRARLGAVAIVPGQAIRMKTPFERGTYILTAGHAGKIARDRLGIIVIRPNEIDPIQQRRDVTWGDLAVRRRTRRAQPNVREGTRGRLRAIERRHVLGPNGVAGALREIESESK